MTIWIIVGVVAFAVLLCFLLAIANHAGERFFDRFEEVNKIEVRSGVTPIQFVDEINRGTFEGKLKVAKVPGNATDGYINGHLLLSEKTLSVNSIASFTIIAHELGHALQDENSKKLKHMIALRRLGRLMGALFAPILIAGVVFLILGWTTLMIAMFSAGGGILMLSLVIKLSTISIEKDASKKALAFLQNYLTNHEMKTAKRFLKDAKLTYWADFLRTLLWWTGMSKKSKLFN